MYFPEIVRKYALISDRIAGCILLMLKLILYEDGRRSRRWSRRSFKQGRSHLYLQQRLPHMHRWNKGLGLEDSIREVKEVFCAHPRSVLMDHSRGQPWRLMKDCMDHFFDMATFSSGNGRWKGFLVMVLLSSYCYRRFRSISCVVSPMKRDGKQCIHRS